MHDNSVVRQNEKRRMCPGGISVLKGCKIHLEQIENVARTLKESTRTRRPDPLPAGRTGNRKPVQQNSGITDSAGHSRVRNTVWATGAVKGPVTDVPTYTSSGTDSPELNLPVIRCFRCGDGFPVLDFLYTKKTGLCISCWETKVV